MRQRFIYLLKHNIFIQKIYRVIMSLVFYLWGSFLSIDDNLVVFVSFMGKGFNDSPKKIFDYISNHKEFNQYHCVWAFENPEKYPNLETVKIDTLKYFKVVLKARYWITNTNIERGLKFKKKDQIYLNTWHGIALKLIGNDCPGRKDYNFDNVNYLVVSGTHDKKVWKSAFNAKESTYLCCGMPRNQVLWNVPLNQKSVIINNFNIPKNKKVILYAPTWRESIDCGKSYVIKPPIHFDVWKEILGNDYVVLFRAHHQTNKILGVEYDDFVKDASSYPDINDLMIASDILITDYSAIAFDYSILCKPIFCYAYDYDSYLSERGTYFEMDEVYPNKSCKTEKELLKKILDIDYEVECKKTKIFRDLFIQYRNDSTETCVKAVFGRSVK